MLLCTAERSYRAVSRWGARCECSPRDRVLSHDHVPRRGPPRVQEPKRLKRLDARMRVRRPSGMNREVYALLYSDSKLG